MAKQTGITYHRRVPLRTGKPVGYLWARDWDNNREYRLAHGAWEHYYRCNYELIDGEWRHMHTQPVFDSAVRGGDMEEVGLEEVGQVPPIPPWDDAHDSIHCAPTPRSTRDQRGRT